MIFILSSKFCSFIMISWFVDSLGEFQLQRKFRKILVLIKYLIISAENVNGSLANRKVLDNFS